MANIIYLIKNSLPKRPFTLNSQKNPVKNKFLLDSHKFHNNYSLLKNLIKF